MRRKTLADLPHVRTNLGNVRPHTLRVAEEIANRWTIHYMWGIGGSGHHAAGRALDIMTLTRDQSALRTRMGNEIAAYLQDNAGRLGILYIIWRQRIWNHSFASDRSRTSWSHWRRMADRGSPTENHEDHVHVSFDANPRPYRAPDGSAPPSGSDGLLQLGSTGTDVRRLQDLLGAHGYDLKIDGIYGPKTEAAVRAYQREHGLQIDGIAGPETMTHLQEGDMPSAKEVADEVVERLLGADRIAIPYADPKNPRRVVRFALESIWKDTHEANRQLRSIAKKVGAEVDEAALAAELLPGLLEAIPDASTIAEAIPDDLAESVVDALGTRISRRSQ